MKIVSIEEIIENDSTYIVTTYDNGYVVQELKPPEVTGDIPEPEIEMTDTELAIYETQVNVEYLVVLQEMNLFS